MVEKQKETTTAVFSLEDLDNATATGIPMGYENPDMLDDSLEKAMPKYETREYYRTEEDLREGVTLEPDEKISFDSSRNPHFRQYGFTTPSGAKLESAQHVADLRLGGGETFVAGGVVSYGAGELLLVIYDAAGRGIEKSLKPGEMFSIGRGVEGQEDLPDTVSRDHCAVGLSKDGELVVENHEPSNYTSVRKLN